MEIMAKKEYIEREAVLKQMAEIKYDFSPTVRPMFDVFKQIMLQTPVADVVKVVRCKYCEHYRPYPKPVEDFDGRCWIRGHETDETEFCSYGVEKGDAE